MWLGMEVGGPGGWRGGWDVDDAGILRAFWNWAGQVGVLGWKWGLGVYADEGFM